MSENQSQPLPDSPLRPVSACVSSVEGLIRLGSLAPPPRPGLLAILDRFEILRLIGAGGMGVVFLAHDPRRDTQVALKLLQPDLATNPVAVRRFLQEARLMQRLEHPHILKVWEVLERPEGPCLVMPFVERGSLAGLLQAGQPLPPEQALELASQVARALEHAHNHGIVHHDLKPGNILLDAQGRALLTDFGLARRLLWDSFVDLDRGHCEGTAPYMSPALAAGKAEDGRCDIYAFGAVLYEMLTGQPPYEGRSGAEIRQKIRDGPPLPVLKRNPQVPPELAFIVEGAMARTLRDRYASMADILADLERVAQGLSPLGPHGQWRIPRKWMAHARQHAGTALRALAPVALVGLIILGASWLRPFLQVTQQFALPEGTIRAHGIVGDWDGDREPDLFVSFKAPSPAGPDWVRAKCLALANDGSLVTEFAPAEIPETALNVCLIGDVNQDGLDDVFLSWAGGGKTQTAAFNRLGFELLRFAIDDNCTSNRYFGRGHTGLVPVRITDLDQDGSMELLALVETTWGLQPRGLWCFDLARQTLRWSFPTAPWPTTLDVADLDGDGTNEVILGSAAVSNGASLPDGTDDSRAYVYAVSSRGRLLWRREFSGGFVRCYPLVLGHGARGRSPQDTRTNALAGSSTGSAWREQAELVVGVMIPHPDPTKLIERQQGDGHLVKLDHHGRTVAEYPVGVSVTSCLAEDLDGDGEPEVLATDRVGLLHVLTPNLKLRRQVQILRTNGFVCAEVTLLTVTNLTRSPGKHLVFSAMNFTQLRGTNLGQDKVEVNVQRFANVGLEVWDSSLRRLARYTFEKQAKEWPVRQFLFADWDGDGAQEIVVLDRSVRVLKLREGLF